MNRLPACHVFYTEAVVPNMGSTTRESRHTIYRKTMAAKSLQTPCNRRKHLPWPRASLHRARLQRQAAYDELGRWRQCRQRSAYEPHTALIGMHSPPTITRKTFLAGVGHATAPVAHERRATRALQRVVSVRTTQQLCNLSWPCKPCRQHHQS